jgi:arginine-tRNA-protein transferase
MRYEFVAEASAADYEQRLATGWRRFGRTWFRPQCPSCTACQSLRIDVARFRPDRTQRRNQKVNAATIRLQIGEPEVTAEKLALYDRFHDFQTENVGWSPKPPKDLAEYHDSFVDNPFPSEEWRYFRGDDLIAVGYVDALPNSLSAIYFFHEPDLRPLGLGVWNVLSCVAEAARRGLGHVYLGYFVDGCRSLEYKARYQPNEAFDWAQSKWKSFRP